MKHTKWIKRIVSTLISTCLLLGASHVPGMMTSEIEVMAEEMGRIPYEYTHVNVRAQANSSSTSYGQVDGGKEFVIKELLSNGWYRVSIEIGGQTREAYIYGEYVERITSSGEPMSDADFEAYLTAQGFPESYRPYLRSIHAKHPNWIFQAQQTGLDWNTVIENERNKPGQVKNLVQGTNVAPRYNWRETSVGYTWATDTWSPFDGTTWFAASKQLVEYYMDPRTYLYENYVFVFERLSYDASLHNQQGVEAALTGTVMANATPAGDTRTYSAIIMEAASQHNISPYHLASRIRHETNGGTSASVTGNGVNGKYTNIYNYYNIGANDSAGGGAVANGLAWASASSGYSRPWNTPAKSIIGGAQYISEGYIQKGQDTLYTQKFNVANKNNLYSHQYMTNVQAPAAESLQVYKAYQDNGLLNQALVFKIPVYVNMPATAVVKPADSGSPNNWLKSLSINGYSLTPTFTGSTVNYSLIVPNNVTAVTISATAVRSDAKITGTGTTNIAVGNNVLPIKVKAANGSERSYSITVVRQAPGTTPAPTTPSFNTSYKVNGTSVSGVTPGTNASNFVTSLGVSGGSATVYKSDGKTVNTGTIGTGNIVKVTNGGTTTSYTVVIYGDVSGDGAVGIPDLVYTKKYILKQMNLGDAARTACDVNKDGAVGIPDLVYMKKHILKQYTIAQ